VRRIDLSIGQRLAAGFGVILLVLVVLFAAFFYQNQRIDAQQHRAGLIASRITAATSLQIACLRQAVAARNFVLDSSQGQLLDYRQAQQAGRQAIKQLDTLPKDPDATATFAEMVSLADGYNQAADRYIALAQQGASTEALRSAEREKEDVRNQLLQRTESYLDLQRNDQQTAMAEIDQTQAEATRDLAVFVALMLVIGTLTALLTARSVHGPARRMVAAARALAGGDHGPALALAPAGAATSGEPPRDELRELAESFARTAGALKHREQRLAARNAVSTSLAASIEVERLGAEALREVADYTHCSSGAVYLHEAASGLLRRVAGLALPSAADVIAVGEGIPGQAAADRRTVVVRDIPADAPFPVRFGFADVPPRAVLAVPIILQDRLVGVLLLVSLYELSDDAIDFVEQSALQLGVSLQNALAHREVERLVVELQGKNTLLQAQNEEIQAQGEEIQSRNEELQAQSEELQAQNEQLLEADRTKDEFLSVASHELKSPITSIKGYSQLLLRRTEDVPGMKEYRGALAAIDRQATALVTRIDRLLDVSRAKMGRLQMRPEPVDLAELVRQVVEQARMRTSTHRVVLNVTDADLRGHWDRLYIEQAIGNLVDNAIRYSPGGGEVQVTLAVVDGQAQVSVADRGIGIPAEVLPKIFQSYFRHETAKHVTGDGMGIGLYITKEIVAAHGGQVWVESEVDRGSTFHLSLPLAAEPQPAVKSPLS